MRGGHIQSLILASILILMGFMTIIIGLQADIIAANRKILQDIQYRIKKIEYNLIDTSAEKEKYKKK